MSRELAYVNQKNTSCQYAGSIIVGVCYNHRVNEKSKEIPFVPGLILAERFFREAVEPILAAHYPDLRYSAALIGRGSEVLGFDTEMSIDHHWGPRVMLFLRPEEIESRREPIRRALSEELPTTFMGYSTNFSAPNPDDKGVQLMQPVESGPVNHRVQTLTINGFFEHDFGFDVSKDIEPADWLVLPHQELRGMTTGRVFRDDLGLEQFRARFAWYPHDVWLYILASGWARIGQDEHLMGRAGYAGDEVGSAVIGARLAREVMRLAFLMEKQYPPYAKWFGTAFSRLKSAAELGPLLEAALHASSWKTREASLSRAYEILVELHNSLGITEVLPARAIPFWRRPFRIIRGEKIAEAIVKHVKDPKVVLLTKRNLIGNIDMISDSTDFVDDPSRRAGLRALYKHATDFA